MKDRVKGSRSGGGKAQNLGSALSKMEKGAFRGPMEQEVLSGVMKLWDSIGCERRVEPFRSV